MRKGKECPSQPEEDMRRPLKVTSRRGRKPGKSDITKAKQSLKMQSEEAPGSFSQLHI